MAPAKAHPAGARRAGRLRQETAGAPIVEEAVEGLTRTAPFDLLSFPADSAERFIDERGDITLTHNDVDWVRLA